MILLSGNFNAPAVMSALYRVSATAILPSVSINVDALAIVVTPLKTGVQGNCNCLISLDSGFRRNDENVRILTCCETVNVSSLCSTHCRVFGLQRISQHILLVMSVAVSGKYLFQNAFTGITLTRYSI